MPRTWSGHTPNTMAANLQVTRKYFSIKNLFEVLHGDTTNKFFMNSGNLLYF